jgi:hypothetical protein
MQGHKALDRIHIRETEDWSISVDDGVCLQ